MCGATKGRRERRAQEWRGEDDDDEDNDEEKRDDKGADVSREQNWYDGELEGE